MSAQGDGGPFDPITGAERAKGDAGGKPPKWRESLPDGASVRHVYHDANDDPAFVVLRWEATAESRKRFAPYTPAKGPDGRDGWQTGYPDGPRVLYRSPELLAAGPGREVWIVEGEKCADAVAKALPDVVVTTWAGGSSARQSTDWTPLANHSVVLIADADDPGRKAMTALAGHLHGLGCHVRHYLPDGDAGDDVADWLEKDGPDRTLARIRDGMTAFMPADDGGAGDDWQDALIEACRERPGTIHKEANAEKIKALHRDDRGAWLNLRARLKRECKDLPLPEFDRLTAANGDGGKQGHAWEWVEPEPWKGDVDGADILDAFMALFDEFAVMPEGGAAACSVWTLWTWVFESFATCPNLMISAPEKETGKSTVSELATWMVFNPGPVSDASAAAIYRSVNARKRTMFFDEGQHFLNRPANDPIRGIIRAAFKRRFSIVERCEGDANVPDGFNVYSPKCLNGRNLVGIDDMITSRSVVISMTRSPRRLPEFRDDRDPVGDELRSKVVAWREAHKDALRDADPDMGDLIHRGAQVWRPLFSVADTAGGRWPALIREAARSLAEATKKVTPGDTLGVELLTDIRQVFEDKSNPDTIPSANLDAALIAMPERPWASMPKTHKEMTSQWRGRTLATYGIKAETLRFDGAGAPQTKAKGYRLAAFIEAWKSYLPGDPSNQTVATVASDGILDFPGDSEPWHTSGTATVRESRKPAETLECHGATVSEPGGTTKAVVQGDDDDPERAGIEQHDGAPAATPPDDSGAIEDDPIFGISDEARDLQRLEWEAKAARNANDERKGR